MHGNQRNSKYQCILTFFFPIKSTQIIIKVKIPARNTHLHIHHMNTGLIFVVI